MLERIDFRQRERMLRKAMSHKPQRRTKQHTLQEALPRTLLVEEGRIMRGEGGVREIYWS